MSKNSAPNNDQKLDALPAQAIIPEQLLHYVKFISDNQAALIESSLVFFKADVAVVVGFSLDGRLEGHTPAQLAKTIDAVLKRKGLERMVVLAPFRPGQAPEWAKCSATNYWQIALPFKFPERNGLAWLVAARPNLKCVAREEKWNAEHAELARRFEQQHRLNAALQKTFLHLPEYIGDNPGVKLFAARNQKGALMSCLIADFSSRHTAFHMLTFSDSQAPSHMDDALTKALIDEAGRLDKKRINIGLDLSRKMQEYADKWGAKIMCPLVETSWEIGDSGKAQALYYNREMDRRREARRKEPLFAQLRRWLDL